MRNATEININAIDRQTDNADRVHKVMERRIQRILAAIVSISTASGMLMDSLDISFKGRNRSTARPKRLVITPISEPMPVIKNTGATASRIARDTLDKSSGAIMLK